jgi:hypothetical protein
VGCVQGIIVSVWGRGESPAVYPLWLRETVAGWRIVLTLDCEAEPFIRTLCHRCRASTTGFAELCNAAEAVLHDVGRGETVRFTTSVSVCRMPRMSALKLVL